MGRQTKRLAKLCAVIATFVAASAPSFADDQAVVIYSRIQNYPGHQLCQVDRNDRRYRELCWQESYHPYGASGYRPYGTFRPYRSVRRIWIAPSAKIVKIDPQN